MLRKVWQTPLRLIKCRFLVKVPHSILSYLILMAIIRSPYTESSRKLVLAFDIGTTYSGVSYAILDPDLVPETKSVGR